MVIAFMLPCMSWRANHREVCLLVEYLIGKMDGTYYHFEKNAPRPVNGKLTLPDRPGFGIELNSSKINKKEIITWRDL